MNPMSQHIYLGNQKAQPLPTGALYTQRTTRWPREYIHKPRKRTCPSAVKVYTCA